MEERVGPDDRRLYVDRDQHERGSKGAFLVTYADPAGDSRWGYFCENCESFDNAMDSMGRIRCNACQNVRKPDEWDDAHE